VKIIPAAWPACLVAASTLAVLPCAPAQAGEEEPQRVEIVGSHLKRPEQEGPTPITIYRRDDIEARGATLLSEFLLSLPFAGAGSFDDRANIFSFHTGTAAISLRGLGPSATLVLLNGRRIAAYGLSLDDRRTFVDLNSIPMAAIDRIEVLRDGASAIYGADAIGGVVNIVLRGDFRGAEASVLAGRSTQGGAGKRYASVSIGTGDSASDGHNVLLIVDALKQDELRMSERAFSSSADLRPRGGVDTRSLFSVPPTVEIDGVPQPGIGCPPERVVPDPLIGGSYCVFDPNPYASLLPQTERIGALAAGSQAMAGSLRMYTELALNRTLTKHGIAPMPVVFLVPAAAPANPYGRDVGVYWRVLDLGQRRTESTVDFARAVAGIQGEWGTWQTWEWDLAVGAATVGTRFSKLNHASSRQVESLVASGALNPFAGGSAPETLSSVGIGGIDRYRGSSRHVLASARSELVQLTHGALAMALGVERRRESFSVVPDPKVIEGDLAGALDSQEGAQRSIDAAFVEVAAPLGRHVEMQLAARHDRYSDFGSSTSPKIAVRWQPSRRLMLRASAGTGFLPPSLQQIHAPEGSLFIPNVDRIRCPVTHSPSDCGSRGILTLLGNSTDLKAETSRQHNIGIVVEPTPGVSVGFDAWHIRHRGKIDMAIGYVLENEALFPGSRGARRAERGRPRAGAARPDRRGAWRVHQRGPARCPRRRPRAQGRLGAAQRREAHARRFVHLQRAFHRARHAAERCRGNGRLLGPGAPTRPTECQPAARAMARRHHGELHRRLPPDPVRGRQRARGGVLDCVRHPCRLAGQAQRAVARDTQPRRPRAAAGRCGLRRERARPDRAVRDAVVAPIVLGPQGPVGLGQDSYREFAIPS
jgi:iron complex outermembrane receptor protein